MTGVVFLLSFEVFGFDIILVRYLGLFSILIVIAFIDLDNQTIPNSLVLAIFVWGLTWQVIYPQISWASSLYGAFLGGGILFLTAVLSRGGMGGGDIKLMLAAGFMLGPQLTGLSLFIAVFSGALTGILLILLKKKERKDPIPFGPFLTLGIFVSTLWGSLIIAFYLTSTGLI